MTTTRFARPPRPSEPTPPAPSWGPPPGPPTAPPSPPSPPTAPSWGSAGPPPAGPPAGPPTGPPEGPAPEPAADTGGDATRAGATWVTATGAFLLFVAAGVFIAVQWGSFPNEVKLGILSALTGGFLLAGRRLRTALPATAGVLYHLGAFLIPVVVAAVAVPREPGWPALLLIEGTTATLTWWWLDRYERSPVLRWATTAAVVVAAAGIGATTGVPAALVLVACSLVAALRHDGRNAISWAALAGLAPVLALAEQVLPLGTGVLRDLGLTAATIPVASLGTGLAAALVLGVEARRRQDLVLVVVGGLAATLGVALAWTGLSPGPEQNVVGAATLFLAAELAAHTLRRDRFWARPARAVACAAEVAAAAVTPLALAVAADRVLRSTPATAVIGAELVAGLLVGAAWFVGDLRRRVGDPRPSPLNLLIGGGWWPATLGLAAAVAVGVAAGTASAPLTAIALVLTAAGLVAAGRPLAHGTAVVLAIGASTLPGLDPALRGGVALVGALVLAGAAVVRARLSDPIVNGPRAWALALAALAPIELAHALLRTSPMPTMVLLVGTVAATWCVAALLDRGAVHGGRDQPPHLTHLGAIGRVAALVTILQAFGAPAGDLAVIALLVAGLALFDAIRLDSPWPLYALPIALPTAIGVGAIAAHLDIAQAGIAVTVLASVLAGIHLLVDGDWRWPVLAGVLASGTAGFALASTQIATGSTALIVIGAIGIGYAISFRAPEGLVFGWIGVTLGIWGHLYVGEVVALDAYLAPVAVALAVAGWRARTTVSSWVAFAPATLLLGGSALLERIDGGPAVHALVAGCVGVAAVLLGGGRRYVAPLLIGTALLIALCAHEALGVSRTVPTWAWLAAGGTLLLGAGIAMERRDTDPFEAGRRVIDTVHERFT